MQIQESSENAEWQYFVKRRYVLLLAAIMQLGKTDKERMEKVLGFDNSFSRCLYVDGIWYQIPHEVRANTERTVRMFEKEPESCERIASQCYKDGKQLQEWTEKIKESSPKNLKTEELLSTFSEYVQKLKDFQAFLLYPIFLQNYLETKIIENLKGKVHKDELFERLAELVSPVKENFNTTEQRYILNLAVSIEKEGLTLDAPQVEDGIREYLGKYSFIGFRHGGMNVWTVGKIKDRLRFIIEEGDAETRLKALENDIEGRSQKTEFLMGKYNFDEELREVVRAAKEIVYMRTYRTDIINMSFYNIHNLLEKIASRFDLDVDDIYHLNPYEVLNLRNTISSRDILDLRKKGFALEIGANEIHIHVGDRLEEIRHMVKVQNPLGEVKGKPASKGIVRGMVKVIGDKTELGKVKKDDILVTAMTTPDFIPAMERAAAFVTDEGGITCHAAIVSRELGKPCIVGTKNATRILKDGELIEVDANLGIVRKL